MKLLTKELQESYENAKICYICKEKFEDKYAKDKKKNGKVRDHCHYIGEYRGAAHSICKIHNLFSSSRKEVTRIGKYGEKSQKPYSTYNNLLIAQEVN